MPNNNQAWILSDLDPDILSQEELEELSGGQSAPPPPGSFYGSFPPPFPGSFPPPFPGSFPRR